MTDTFAYAKAYRALGFSVIPTRAVDKRPVLKWTAYQDEAAGVSDLRRWFVDEGYEGVGIVTGEVSGLLVLDIDGDTGRKSMVGLGVPATPMVDTPRGRHVYFAHPGGRVSNAVGLRPGLDIRGDGGYVVAPPTPGYEWRLSPREVDLAPPPAWLLERLQEARQAKPVEEWRSLTASEVVQGHRDQTMAKLVGYLIGKGVDPVVTFNLVMAFNVTNVKPPLPQADIQRITRSIVDLDRRNNS